MSGMEGTEAVSDTQNGNSATGVSTLEEINSIAGSLSIQSGYSTEENRPQIMLATLKAWGKVKIYETKGVKETKKKISSQDCVCVIGVPGAGKSTAIQQAALLLQTQGFIIYSIHELGEFMDYYRTDKKQVFVLDNVIGVYSLDQGKVDLWDMLKDKIRNSLGRNTKLLVSTRTQLYNQTVSGNDFVFLDKCNCIDFSDKAYRLDEDDMYCMLRHYLTVAGIQDIDGLIRDASLWNTKVHKFSDCFPLLCKVFCSDKSVRQNPREFFINPFQALTKIFKNIKSDNKQQFCALVLCSVFNGKLTENMFSFTCELNNELDKDSVIKRNVIMKACQLEGQLQEIKTALNCLDGVYITHIEKTYKMSLAVFQDVVIYLFNDADPSFVLQYGTSEFIRDRIRLNKAQDDPYMIVINDYIDIQRLADRLVTDCFSDKGTRDASIWPGAEVISRNPNIDNDRLISCLKRSLSDVDQTQINELFIQCIRTVYGNRVTYKGDKPPQDKLIELCIQRGADCNMDCCDGDGYYPLHRSVGSIDIVQLLLRNNSDSRMIDWFGDSVLHLVCKYTDYHRLETVKYIIQHLTDQSVVRFITNDRQKVIEILEHDSDDSYNRWWRSRGYLYSCYWDSVKLQLEKVLPDQSIEVLTTDKHEMETYVENCTDKLQLVYLVHDNVVTYVDRLGRNILHYSSHDMLLTIYLLGVVPHTAINQRDDEHKTPFWYVVNRQHPERGKVKVYDEDVRKEVIELYEKYGAVV